MDNNKKLNKEEFDMLRLWIGTRKIIDNFNYNLSEILRFANNAKYENENEKSVAISELKVMHAFLQHINDK